MPVNDDNDEGTQGRLIIPAAAVKLGVTPDNMGTKAAGALPAQHWGASIQAGKFKVDKGAVYAREPGPPDRLLFVDAAPDDPPKVTLDDLESVKPEDLRAANKEVVEWLARKSGKSLGPSAREALRNLYVETHKSSIAVAEAVPQNAAQPQVDTARRTLAAHAAKLLLEERKLFEDNDAAQSDRFGRPIITHSRQTPGPQELQDAIYEMLSGTYMKAAAGAVSSESTETNAEPIVTAVGAWGTTIRLRIPAAVLAGTTHTTTRSVAVGAPRILGWEARMYVAEHDLFATDWEVIFGIDGIVHTSIVAGVWRIQEQDFDVQTFQAVSSVAGASITADAVRRLAYAQPISTQRERRTTRVFAGWLVGNGCASTYFADDELTLIQAAVFASYESAARWVKTLTATAEGKYYPIRGCAYSVGNYGIHWVCHQMANAFATRKWARAPVSYLVSHILFGAWGVQGISKRLDWEGGVHKGCAAGAHCYYNVAPPYADPALALLEEPLMSGHAYGVDVHWNPNKRWVQSEASYRSHPVPIPGWSENISVQVVQTTPATVADRAVVTG